MWFRQQSITIQKCLCLKDHYSSKKIIERISRPCKHTNIVFFFECFCNQKRPFMYNLYVFSPQKSRFQSCCLHNHSNFQIQTPSAIRNLLHLAELWGRIHPHCSLEAWIKSHPQGSKYHPQNFNTLKGKITYCKYSILNELFGRSPLMEVCQIS